MKKLRRLAALLLALTVIFSAFTTVSAASVAFPEALTVIEDEAFADSELFQGLVDVPSGVTHIGSNAFGSGVYALKIPQTVKTLDAQTASEMAYIYLNSSTLPSSLTNEINARYLFSQATYANMWAPFIGAYFVNALSLQEYDGFYYQINPDTNRLKLLCAVDNTAVPESVTIPENIFGRDVEALSPNAFFGCEHVTSITLMGSPEEQEGCFDGAPNAVVNRHVDPEISLQLADGFVADWFSEIPVQIKNTSYEAGSASIACTVEFVNYSGQVLFKVENAASLPIPQPFATAEHSIAVDNQLWARAYQAGSRVLRISLAPEAGVPVAANEHSITIELPYTPSCPIVLLEYSQTARPNSAYTIKATCLNPDKMTEYRPVTLYDQQGNQLAVCYIGTYHPTGELTHSVGQDAPSYTVTYPGANGATYTHAINPTMSALTGVSGADSTGVTLSAGQTVTVECTYAGAMPQITCTSGNTYVAFAQINGSTLTITAVGNGSTSITVTDGAASFVIPVTVENGKITGILYNGVRVDDSTRVTFGLGETVLLECTYSGAMPSITCSSWGTSIAEAQVNGAVIAVTGVGAGSTYLNVSDGSTSYLIPVTVESGTITGIRNPDGTDGYTMTYLSAGETRTLYCTYTGIMPKITCTSTNESVVTAQVDGTTITITAVGSGSAFINISDGSAIGWSIPVTVASGEITGISQIYAVAVNVGETSTLVVDYTGSPVITCTSFNESIATIERDERYILVHGVSAGVTNVEIRDDSGNAYYFEVRVSDGNAPFMPFELTGFNYGNDATVIVGQAVKLYTQYTLGSGLQDPSVLTCTSSDESIAKVLSGDIAGFTVLGMSAGTVQLTATDGQNSFTINMSVTYKAVPTFELVMENDGATIDNETHNPIKLRSDMPEDQFVMPGSIRLEGLFFAEDGTFLRKYVWYAIPLDAPGIKDQTITLQHHYYDEMYTWGASYVQVRPIQPYADFVGNYSLEYFVKNPDQYLTFYMPEVSKVNYPIYTLRTDAPMVDHQIVVRPGTEVELTLECLNPYYFYGYTYPVFQIHPDGTETEIGAMSRENYSITITVPPQDVATYTASFRVPWFTAFGSARINIQYVAAFEMEDMLVPVGGSSAINFTGDTWLTPTITIADESIATVKDRKVIGVAPGMTTVMLQYGPFTETAQVRVYDDQTASKATLSFADEQTAWPWMQDGVYWPVKVQADKPVQQLAVNANASVTVAFKDAQDNIIETYRSSLTAQFVDSNVVVGGIGLDKPMLSRLAALGVVKATVKMEEIRGKFTFDVDNRTVDIPMDDLSNYADYPMFRVVNNNSNDLKMGDTASFTLCGNPAADRDYNILITYMGQMNTTGWDTLNVTYNPAVDGEKEILLTVPSDCIAGRNSFNVRFQYEDPNNQNTLTEIVNTWVYIAE